MSVAPALYLHTVMGLATSSAFAFAGRAVLRRRSGTANDSAHVLLALFWGSLALMGLGTAVSTASIALGGDMASHGTTALALAAVLLPFSMWAISSYLAYLIRGDHGLTLRLAFVHVAIGMLFVAVVGWIGPPSLLVGADGPFVRFSHMLPPWAVAGLLVISVLPLAAMAGAFGMFVPRLEERSAKRRSLFLGLALAIWAGRSFLSGALVQGAPLDTAAATWATLVLGLLPALLIVLAYRQEKPNVKAGLGTPA